MTATRPVEKPSWAMKLVETFKMSERRGSRSRSLRFTHLDVKVSIDESLNSTLCSLDGHLSIVKLPVWRFQSFGSLNTDLAQARLGGANQPRTLGPGPVTYRGLTTSIWVFRGRFPRCHPPPPTVLFSAASFPTRSSLLLHSGAVLFHRHRPAFPPWPMTEIT